MSKPKVRETWVIVIGAGYGAVLFQGTRTAAERMRIHKARRERAIAKKRPATALEIERDQASPCLNHPGFGDRFVYHDCACDDPLCVEAAMERLDREVTL